MGAYGSLRVARLDLVEMHTTINAGVLALFTPAERQETHELYEGYDESTPEDEKEWEDAYFYAAPVGVLCDRLDVIGYTEARARRHFRAYSLMNKENPDSYQLPVADFEGWQRHIAYAADQKLSQWSINSVQNRERRLPRQVLQSWDELEYPRLAEFFDDDEYYSGIRLGFPTEDCDTYLFLRAIWSSLDRELPVVLDYTSFINEGYFDSPELFLELRDKTTFQASLNTVLLTEGSTDQAVLGRALAYRFGHLAHLYRFLDFHGGKVAGGAPELVKLVRAFAGCGLSGRFIAIFDADTAAAEALSELDQARLPDNIKVLQLPELEAAKQYPTIGPQGDNVVMDVNCMACSLEMYLGRSALQSSSGELVKVQWSGYSKKMRRYQGELIGKDQVRERFLERLEREPGSLDWSGLDLIFGRVFEAFNQDQVETR
jgi:hypothetical protein